MYRCDAVNKAGATHIVYRVNIVAGPKVKDIVAFTNGEGVTVDGSVEIVVSTVFCRTIITKVYRANTVTGQGQGHSGFSNGKGVTVDGSVEVVVSTIFVGQSLKGSE